MRAGQHRSRHEILPPNLTAHPDRAGEPDHAALIEFVEDRRWLMDRAYAIDASGMRTELNWGGPRVTDLAANAPGGRPGSGRYPEPQKSRLVAGAEPIKARRQRLWAKAKNKDRAARPTTDRTIDALRGVSFGGGHWVAPTPLPRSALSKAASCRVFDQNR